MNQRGVTYIETVATVALVGIAVLAATALTAAHPSASERLEAQRDMMRALDALVEDVRAGKLRAQDGPVVNPLPMRRSLRLHLSVDDAGIDGLIRLRATARCTVRQQQLTRELVTAIWRPS